MSLSRNLYLIVLHFTVSSVLLWFSAILHLILKY